MAKLGEYETNNIYNEDCYEAIKKIPDKSIDLVYIDIPYLIESGGTGTSEVAKRIHKLNYETLANIRDGIDYSIFEELCRVMKHIFIYIWCSKEQILDITKYFVEEKGVKVAKFEISETWGLSGIHPDL